MSRGGGSHHKVCHCTATDAHACPARPCACSSPAITPVYYCTVVCRRCTAVLRVRQRDQDRSTRRRHDRQGARRVGVAAAAACTAACAVPRIRGAAAPVHTRLQSRGGGRVRRCRPASAGAVHVQEPRHPAVAGGQRAPGVVQVVSPAVQCHTVAWRCVRVCACACVTPAVGVYGMHGSLKGTAAGESHHRSVSRSTSRGSCAAAALVLNRAVDACTRKPPHAADVWMRAWRRDAVVVLSSAAPYLPFPALKGIIGSPELSGPWWNKAG